MQFDNKRILFIVSLFLLFPLLSAMTMVDSAPAGGLPVRPTAVPTAAPTAPTAPQKGALITLDLDATAMGVWTQVEWQDPITEAWTAVDGWRGNADENGDVTWWVAPADLDSGPFRWVVYESESNASAMLVSDTFDLPLSGQLVVTISD